MTVVVDFKNVDIVFGSAKQESLALIDAGASREEILAKNGSVLGCANANLTVHEGEISVLMGLSGSGKSTLLRAVNRLNIVTRGQVLVKDGDKVVDIVTCGEATLRRLRQNQVAMVFQQFGLLPWRSVEENVGIGLELAGIPDAERKARVDRQLKLVHLDQWSKKYAHELSGGMQQRVGLARALATEAPILLMDEPFSALDPLIRTKLQDELLQLQAQLKKTIIFVSHDLEEALKIGNRITMMESGRIVQTGAPEDIVLRPANDYVREFISNVNPLSVLTAWNVMRDRRDLAIDEGWVWLDDSRRARVKVDADGEVKAFERDGKPADWIPGGDAESRPEDPSQLFWVHAGTSLKTVMLAMHRSFTAPVAVLEGGKKFLGAVSIRDVLNSIVRR